MNNSAAFQIGTPVYVVRDRNKPEYGVITDMEQYTLDYWYGTDPLPREVYQIRLGDEFVYYTDTDINHTVFAALLKPNQPVEVRRYRDEEVVEPAYVFDVRVDEEGIYYAVCIGADSEIDYFDNNSVYSTIFPYEVEAEHHDSPSRKFQEGQLVYVERDYYIVAAIVHDYNSRTKEYTLTSDWRLFKVKEGDIYSTYEEAIQDSYER